MAASGSHIEEAISLVNGCDREVKQALPAGAISLVIRCVREVTQALSVSYGIHLLLGH